MNDEDRKKTESTMDEIPVIHIHGQSAQHDEVFILANVRGLFALRDAIDKAVLEGSSRSDVMVNDGEYFDVYVCRVTREMTPKLAVPYTENYAKGSPDSEEVKFTQELMRELYAANRKDETK